MHHTVLLNCARIEKNIECLDGYIRFLQTDPTFNGVTEFYMSEFMPASFRAIILEHARASGFRVEPVSGKHSSGFLLGRP